MDFFSGGLRGSHSVLIPEKKLEALGFRIGATGTHTSRTMMLAELRTLIGSAPMWATAGDYFRMGVAENCLAKRTLATRRSTMQRLSELYALDGSTFVFRTMRALWQHGEAGQPLLALLSALARDPLLRLTAPAILLLPPGDELGRQALTDALVRGTNSRLNDAVLDKVVRNASSSWTQSGHLAGRNRKRRTLVEPTAADATFALSLGYVSGVRGAALFETLWTKVLDSGVDQLISLATDAKRQGLLDMKSAGGMVEISFPRLLTEEERRLIHGTN